MADKTSLTIAAEAVRDARAELERIDGRLDELREKSRDLDELKATLAGAREQRSTLLEEALIAGRKADTTEIDKEVATAQRALQKREDEITAVERALATLAAQRHSAQTALHAATETLRESCASRVLGVSGELLKRTHEAAAVLGRLLNENRALLGCMRLTGLEPDTRRWFAMQQITRRAELDLLERGLVSLTMTIRGFDGSTMGALDDELSSAHKLAGIDDNGYVHRDGTTQAEPEPPAEAVRTIRMTDGAPGMRAA